MRKEREAFDLGGRDEKDGRDRRDSGDKAGFQTGVSLEGRKLPCCAKKFQQERKPRSSSEGNHELAENWPLQSILGIFFHMLTTARILLGE